MKYCPKCKSTKTLDSFAKATRTKDGKQGHCKACQKVYYNKKDKDKTNAYWRKWRKNNPNHNETAREYKRNNPEMMKGISMLQYWPGVGWQQALKNYNDLLALQDNKCAICGQPETRKASGKTTPKDLCVDHNHITNKVRGLLCDAHNTAIGLLSLDSTDEIAKKVVVYYGRN